MVKALIYLQMVIFIQDNTKKESLMALGSTNGKINLFMSVSLKVE